MSRGSNAFGGRYPIDSRPWMWWVVPIVVAVVAPLYFVYEDCRIDVPNKHMAILTHKTGKDLEPRRRPGPIARVQGRAAGRARPKAATTTILMNGHGRSCRRSRFPKASWACASACTARTWPPGELIAEKESQKGIVPEVLRPGRYPINACW